MDFLTNDAKFLLTSMYAEYLTRHKDEVSKKQARNFQNIKYLKDNIMSEWSEEDILDTCFELDKYGYIIGTKADNTFYTLSLTTEAIAELENQFREPTLKERIENVLDFAAKIKSVIPFV
ncbi:TPA: hypothetical protein VY837_000640 [Streptococcus pneumoniae]|nr:hypothetical protein [Streptococcus pneumoniae]